MHLPAGLVLPRFDSPELERRYALWRQKTKGKQTASIAALTGALYMVAAGLDSYLAPPELVEQMVRIHLVYLPVLLFVTAACLLFERSYNVGIGLLFLAPVVAAFGNVVIVTQLEHPEIYQTEVYLILFWVFTVSGLRFYQAILSTLLIGAVVLTATILAFPGSDTALGMHFFWIFAAVTFGMAAAFFLERSERKNFSYNLQLEKMAVTDKLTGLYNRSALDGLLQAELYRRERFGRPFAVALLDVDLFKSVNDEHGHLVGDQVLVNIAKVLQSNVRKTDIVGRWGGEEFLVLFVGAGAEEVGKLAEKLRARIEVPDSEGMPPITASLGATSYAEDDTAMTILNRADSALYEAKARGRNQVVVKDATAAR